MPFPLAADTPGLSAALAASPPYSCVRNFYVNVNASNASDFNPGTLAQPWKTIYAAQGGIDDSSTYGYNIAQPGDCINVLPGTYQLTYSIPLIAGGNTNTATGYVVYRSTVPQGAHIVPGPKFASNNAMDMFYVTTGYFIIDGFEIDGGNAVATGTGTDGGSAVTIGDGVDGCYAGGQKTYSIAHHVVVINNIIHSMGGSGISSCNAEFIIWRNNVVYNTSSTSPWQKSGLDINGPQGLTVGTYSAGTSSYTPTAWDTATTYGIQILYNIVHDNVEGPAITWARRIG
jgi:hypothetical protein